MATVIPPAAVPSALFAAASRVPALTFVTPLYVLLPERVNDAGPLLGQSAGPAHDPGVDRGGIVAPGGQDAGAEGDVAAPAREPTVSAKLFRLNVAPPATVTALASAMRLAAPSRKVPAFTVVEPV